jgi:membrane protein
VNTSTIWTIIRDSFNEWMEDNAPRLAAALAFYTILSVAPLLMIILAVVGFFFDAEVASAELTNQMGSTFGEAGSEVVKTVIENSKEPSGGIAATIIGVVTILFGASGMFGELQGSLNTVWDVKQKSGRGFFGVIRDRFLSFGMVLVVGFALLVSLVLTTLLAAFGEYLGGLVAGLPVLMQIANFLLSFVLIAALFAMIFKFLPDVKIGWRDVWFGAFVTSLLFIVGKYLIGFYLGKAGFTTPFGAAGSLVAFVVWIYYSALILFFGAELTQVTMKQYGRRIEPTENAESTSYSPRTAEHVSS